MDRERMHAAGKFVRQRRIDHAMPLEPALPTKGFRHDIESEMRLAARPVPGMALVPMRFILDMKALRCESVAQLFRDQIACVHRTSMIPKWRPVFGQDHAQPETSTQRAVAVNPDTCALLPPVKS